MKARVLIVLVLALQPMRLLPWRRKGAGAEAEKTQPLPTAVAPAGVGAPAGRKPASVTTLRPPRPRIVPAPRPGAPAGNDDRTAPLQRPVPVPDPVPVTAGPAVAVAGDRPAGDRPADDRPADDKAARTIVVDTPSVPVTRPRKPAPAELAEPAPDTGDERTGAEAGGEEARDTSLRWRMPARTAGVVGPLDARLAPIEAKGRAADFRIPPNAVPPPRSRGALLALGVVAVVGFALAAATYGLPWSRDDTNRDSVAFTAETPSEEATAAPSEAVAAPPAPEPSPEASAVPSESAPEPSNDIAAAQQQLTDLRYYVGPIDGQEGAAFRSALMAFQKVNGLAADGVLGPATSAALQAPRTPELRGGEADRVEVDLTLQVLYLVDGGELSRILPVSSGSGEAYAEADGSQAVALTPVGTYRIERRIRGVREAPLGTLYDPLYFYQGWAIHGSNSVPAYPASHGCVRVTRADATWLFERVPVGTQIVLYGGTHTFTAGSTAAGTDTPAGDTPEDAPVEPGPAPAAPPPADTPGPGPEPGPNPAVTPTPTPTPSPGPTPTAGPGTGFTPAPTPTTDSDST